MGKHKGKEADETLGPVGPGPHPTPEESKQKADSFERQYEYNKKRGEKK
jgi:hypothetical protein